MEIIKAENGKEYFKLSALHTNGIYKSILIEKEDFKAAIFEILQGAKWSVQDTNAFFFKSDNK